MIMTVAGFGGGVRGDGMARDHGLKRRQL